MSMTAAVPIGPTTLYGPLPVALVAVYDAERGRTNLSTVAWTGVAATKPPQLTLSLKPERLTTELLGRERRLTLLPVTRELVTTADFCGTVSGREVDKFAECGLEPVPLAGRREAIPAGAPIAVLCSCERDFDLGSHRLFILRVDDVLLAPELVDPDGAAAPARAGLVGWLHGAYHALGEPLGFFGSSRARPAIYRRRMAKLRQRTRIEKASKKR
ncbi:MAG: flavin reductase family protein [Bacillota bacterium]|nr:flavin reductase family protein [Bacillota bacterium]